VIKMVVLLFGLGIGFGVGVYWGVNHPVEAKRFADEEERRVLEKQKQLLAKIRSKLDQLANGGTSAAPTGATTGTTGGRSGFIGSTPPAKADPEIDRLRTESDQQMNELDRLLKK